MTTNSPNPVDGDVQALIADCKAEIAELEKVLAIDEYAAISHLQSKLKRQQVALAALTAEPVADVVAWSHPQEERKCAVHLRKFDLMPGRLYTIPTAQLLRPVELPQSFYGVVQDGKSVMLAADDGQWLNKTAVMEALRQQGYEVKND